MKKTILLILLAINVLGQSESYGEKDGKALPVSLLAVVATPEKFAGKKIGFWCVFGDVDEALYVFTTSDHARWRDIESGIRCEPGDSLKEISFGSEQWRNLRGKVARVEGVLLVDVYKGYEQRLMAVTRIFIPDDTRKGAK